jgi:hypothetical protein
VGGRTELPALLPKLNALRTGAFVYEVTFELGHTRENRQHHTARWRRRVGPQFVQGSQTRFGLFQQFGDTRVERARRSNRNTTNTSPARSWSSIRISSGR